MLRNILKFIVLIFTLLFLTSCLTIKTKNNVAIDYFNLGNSYLELKNYSKAIESYEKALDYNPKSEEVIFNLTLSYHLNKNYEKAEKLIVTNFKKNNSEYTKKLLMLLGNNYFLQEKYDQSLKTFNEYATIYTDDANCSFNIGLTYLKLGGENQAFSYFIDAYKKDSKHIPAIYNIADFYVKKKELENAHNYFSMILDLDKKNADVYYRLADVEYSLNEFEHAKNNLIKAIEIDDKVNLYYLLLAKVYAKGYKDKDKTLEYLEKAFIAGFKDSTIVQSLPEFKILYNLMSNFYLLFNL
jgi:protein O-GlcNAc transferase